jgi:hypothetical protein
VVKAQAKNSLTIFEKEKKMKKLITISLTVVFFCTLNAYAEIKIIDAPGASYTEAYGIYGGNVAGSYYKDSIYHGFHYDGSTWTTLDAPGASRTMATDVYENKIVGWYLDGSDHGFIYDGSTWTPLDKPGASLTNAFGIDGDNIVGHYSYGPADHGFIYNISSSTWTTFDIAGADNTRIYGIDGDYAVGFYSKDFIEHGFFYNIVNSEWKPIDVEGAGGTTPCDIDGSKVVGWYQNRSFLYDISSSTLKTDLFGAGYVAHGISGDNIVGLYGTHGFIAIPEPATIVLLTLGGIVLRKHRR